MAPKANKKSSSFFQRSFGLLNKINIISLMCSAYPNL